MLVAKQYVACSFATRPLKFNQLPWTDSASHWTNVEMALRQELSPSEIAAIDVAFEAGIAEAIKQSSALLMMRMLVADHPTWICAYPPAFVEAKDMPAWAARQGYTPQDGDLYIPREQVLRAAKDLGIA